MVHESFRPTDNELRWAGRVLSAATEQGVSVVDGAMIDRPVLARAEAILERAREAHP